MIHTQNHRVVAELPTAAVGSTATATLTIDTIGYDYCSLAVLRASNSSTTFANVLKVEESDDNSSYGNVTALVAGGAGGFTVPAITAAGTNSVSVVKLDVDTKARKRYLKVSYTPGASATVAITGRLARAESSPSTASEANVLTWVRG
ncbi:MAG: hypothetical protein EBR82_76315 [Caulobacteraceae bacterium]|nr:hypothetical protein [Caulobacteraceae bacterium]